MNIKIVQQPCPLHSNRSKYRIQLNKANSVIFYKSNENYALVLLQSFFYKIHCRINIRLLLVKRPVQVKQRSYDRCIFNRSFAYFNIHQLTNSASIVIFVFSNLLIGQFAFASSAHSSNFSFEMPGIFAFTTRCDSVIVPASSVIVQLVSMLSGVYPASPNTKLNFILKHPECAAATSSSGLVPAPSSKRDL